MHPVEEAHFKRKPVYWRGQETKCLNMMFDRGKMYCLLACNWRYGNWINVDEIEVEMSKQEKCETLEQVKTQLGEWRYGIALGILDSWLENHGFPSNAADVGELNNCSGDAVLILTAVVREELGQRESVLPGLHEVNPS